MDCEEECFFSIIVPAYNVEKYLVCCVDSVLRQPFSRYEIILVDDGSRDLTSSICDDLAQKDNRIKVIHKTNEGLSSARNAGIEHATGKYLIFLDGDDELSEDALFNLHEIITERGSPDVCIGQFDVIGENCKSFSVSDYPIDTKEMNRFDRNRLLDYLLTHTYLHSACKLIICRDFVNRKKLFFKNGIYHEDELWVATTFVKIETFCLCNQTFYKYKLHQNSIMTSHNIKKIMDRLEVAKELLKLADTVSEESIEKRYLMERVTSLIWSAFTEVLPYKKNEMDRALDAIDELARIEPASTSKLSIYSAAKVLGFRKAFRIYYLYYRVKRKLIA